MVVNNFVKAWKDLENAVNKIQDKVLLNTMMAELKQKALKEWGFFPKTGQLAKKEEIKLDKWEKEFVEDIKKTEDFEIDVRKEKRKETEKEAHIRMADFIEKGGKFSDLPEDLQNKYIAKLYIDVFFEKMDNCIKNLDFLEKKSLQENNKIV